MLAPFCCLYEKAQRQSGGQGFVGGVLVLAVLGGGSSLGDHHRTLASDLVHWAALLAM
jgi:hypothetical protein